MRRKKAKKMKILVMYYIPLENHVMRNFFVIENTSFLVLPSSSQEISFNQILPRKGAKIIKDQLRRFPQTKLICVTEHESNINKPNYNLCYEMVHGGYSRIEVLYGGAKAKNRPLPCEMNEPLEHDMDRSSTFFRVKWRARKNKTLPHKTSEPLLHDTSRPAIFLLKSEDCNRGLYIYRPTAPIKGEKEWLERNGYPC